MKLNSVIILCLSLIEASIALVSALKNYDVRDLREICYKNGDKKEIWVGRRPAIFQLAVEPGKLAEDFMCHLELEFNPGYGLHVYIEEMHLRGKENLDDCPDYIRFGRDVGPFTTYRSPKYCGTRPRVNLTGGEGRGPRGGTLTRFYIEERDSEMDFKISVQAAPQWTFPRNLSVVVTTFKPSCSVRDRKFVQCPQTKSCIRKELFCDSVPNCAWPNGDFSTDELDCDSESASAFSASNIPIVIIAIIVVIAIVVVIAMTIRHLWRTFTHRRVHSSGGGGGGPETQTRTSRSSRPRASRMPSAPDAPLEEMSLSQNPAGRGHATAPPGDEVLSAPPSYEDIIKEMPESPPPYSVH